MKTSISILLPIIIASPILIVIGYFFGYKAAPIPSTKNYNYEIALECQKLAALTNQEEWSYKACVNELKNSFTNSKLLSI